jgi:hypothetical protein
MNLAVVHEQVYRFWNISGPRWRAHANREPDQKETCLLMANSDPMERGDTAAPPPITSPRRRPSVTFRGDH